MDEPHNSGQQNSPSREDLTGRVLGRFRVKSRLGEGGMGEVYLAEDTKLRRPVALKRIAPQWRADPRLAERFRREVELASRLSHPHIAAVYDVFDYEGETFLVMEYVEGETLRNRLAGAPISIDEFLEIARQCASALAAAHEHGVLHRDLKPENILITRDGQVKILDFGLAKALPRNTESTLPVTVPGLKGTPGYMAPEALLEKEVDARSDLFSLGVVFYELLAGKHPFMVRGDSFVTTVNRVLGAKPKPLSSLNSQVTPQIEAIVARLLEKEPVARYVSATQLGTDLKAAAGGSGITTPISVWQFRPRRRKRAMVAVIVMLALGAGGFALYRRLTRPVVTTQDWILMADFSNQTKQPIFDDTVSEALRDALQQSRRVRLVPRSQILAAAKLMGRTDIAKVDPALGRQICQREGYRGLLTGEIRNMPPDYVVSVQIEDPVLGIPVYTDQASFREPAQLYSAVDGLARRLRQDLGETLTEIRKSSAPLAQVTTPSLDALQRYTRGVRLYNEGRYTDALALFQSAISLDPDFAMAHLYSALLYDYLGNIPSEKAEMAKAMDGITRVSERERYQIQALNLQYEGDYAKAVEQYRILTEIYPNDLDAWKGLGEAAEFAGMYDQAIEAERHILKLSPDSGLEYQRLVTYLAKANHPHEALAAFQEAQKRGIDTPDLHWGAGIAYLVLGTPDAATKQFKLCGRSDDPRGQNLGALYQAVVLLYDGKLSNAVEELRSGMVLDVKLKSEAWTPMRRYLLGGALLAQGKTAEARQDVRELAPLAGKLDVPIAYTYQGILAVRTGQHALAQSALSALDKLRAAQPNSAWTSSNYDYVRGAIALSEGRPADALRDEQRAYAYYVMPGILRVQADAYAALKQWNKAADSYRDYLDHKGEIFNYESSADWALAHIDLARALARAGRTKEAVQAYDAFLKLWAEADPDLPALSEARAEKAKLESATTALLLFRQSSPESSERRLPWQEKRARKKAIPINHGTSM
jgi:tetratricopeptide (TPR) repeat protein/tRNA A-37 threonylcarbamoyl transferase component Bud32